MKKYRAVKKDSKELKALLREYSKVGEDGGLVILQQMDKKVMSYIDRGGAIECAKCGKEMEDKGNRYACDNPECSVKWVSK